jgi:hypothetical protein
MGVRLISSFDMCSNIPIDSRLVVNLVNAIPVELRYEGMLVYEKDRKRFFQYIDDEFKGLDESFGVSSFNGKSGEILVVGLDNVTVEEDINNPGEFKISLQGVILSNGSVEMDNGYSPTTIRSVATKGYVDMGLGSHVNTKASSTTMGHVKIDGDTIQENDNFQIYVKNINGGVF